MTSEFVDAVLFEWSRLEDSLAAVLVRQSFDKPAADKTVIAVETKNHLASIEVGERPHSLEASVLAKGARVPEVVAAGPCDGRAELVRRLTAVRDGLLAGHAR